MRAARVHGKLQMAQAFYQMRSALSAWWGFAAAGAFAALVAQGFFLDLSNPDANPIRFGGALVLCGLLVARLVGRLKDSNWTVGLGRRIPDPAQTRVVRIFRDIEVGLLLVVAVHAVLQFVGGLASPLYPLLYALACFVVAADGLLVGGLLVAASLGIEFLTIRAQAGGASGMRMLAMHAAFNVFFAAVGVVFLRAEAYRLRRKFHASVKNELDRVRREASEYRLIGASLGTQDNLERSEQLEKLWQGSVEAIHQSLFYIVDMLKQSLELQSCVLLWLDDSGTRLEIREMVSDSDMISSRSVPSRSGLAGGVLKAGKVLHLCPVRQPAAAFPYYQGPEQVGAFLGLPVREGGYARGVLCADRRTTDPFSERDVAVMERAAEQVVRTIQAERLFCSVERSKYEQERFFKASEMLNQALGLKQVLGKAFEAARQIVAFDAGMVTLYDEANHRHRVAAVEGLVPEDSEGLEFGKNGSLVDMVVRNRHYLPVGGRWKRNQVVLTKKHPFEEMGSLLVMPLVGGDHVVGTFVLASKQSGLFTSDRREMLRVIGHQVAVSIQNALMLQRLEEMATTDGLTGLLNHRTFQDRITEMLARAERSQRPVSMVLTDIDHFKSVNDTYGHPVGDQVLRGVSKVLATSVRTIDVVARYGGEEFAIVLEDTDGTGAVLLAERIREEVSKLRFDSDQGPFQVTISLGVATFPEHGTHKQEIIEHSDQALYRAKETGRNQVVFFGDM